ncbi:MAG TPA: endopeptidase La [Acidobacteriota bacterium]|nr:endopeptidase La [Acidobacteriota bacterium]HOS99852.1 endopeptidase La [Acidobacteriota bacterium]HQF86605.1 endopeptidase La [Acidobacteriota bacterium]HQG90143.1 endopeptidase La [Acidobacteriota bacterium]HQK86821.1 endopeptidase La [Acidobacteriota bacterium]
MDQDNPDIQDIPVDLEERPADGQIQIPEVLPVLPLRDIVVFPFMIVPLYVSRPNSVAAVDYALSKNRMILLVAQKNAQDEDPGADDIYRMGTVGIIMRMLKLPDGRLRILVQGVMRAKIESMDFSGPFIAASVQALREPEAQATTIKAEALVRNIKSAMEQANQLGKNIAAEIMVIISNLDDPGRLADIVAANLDLKVKVAQDVLSQIHTVRRLQRVHELLKREIELLEVQQQINSQAKDEIDKSQKEYFLRQQLKAIQDELNEGNEFAQEIKQYREKAAAAKMPVDAFEEVDRQISRLEKMHPESAEAATMRTWLDWVVNLPWSKHTRDNLNLAKAQKILDQDHYDLEKIKERIVEHLAVRKISESNRGPILCFVGPPGVGKTSLGRSIARALGRQFVRLSLGGVHDEAEIRGHRRTYVGAMPGRIIQGIHQAGTNNPVFMMDEVDKIGADFRGDPSSALLEVLDPEQNFSFRDNYLGVAFDLSNVLFITTANILDTVQPAFLDRMEVIHLSGYSEQEKLHIARRFLIPKQLKEHGLNKTDLAFTDGALLAIINGYTREAGLRNLEREIARICRKVARRVAEGKRKEVRITPRMLATYLGPERIPREKLLKENRTGIVTGLAWTPTGGDVLFVEAISMKGKGTLMLTGMLGEVMQESAKAAHSFARAYASQFGIADSFFEERDIHIHVPEGAIPKDGPSAGVAMATALVSVCTGNPVRRDLAMTGEITLRGDVLPIGGVKEKILAARRADIFKVILPAPNRKDVEDLPEFARAGMKFIYVDGVRDVLKHALQNATKQAAPKTKPGGKHP